jgi:prepilin-type N-terminal cleavage/methylation domain-containing protein
MKNKGFTLIELVVVIAIISILSGVFLANYRGGDEEFSLKRSVYKLAQNVRSAQEKSMASQSFNGAYQGGFGVSLTESSSDYIIFVDCNGDGIYNGSLLTCADCTGETCIEERFTEEVETLSFEKGVSVLNISPSFGGVFSVVFTPPDPTVYFSPDTSEVSINIQALISGILESKIVKINKAGLISVLQ